MIQKNSKVYDYEINQQVGKWFLEINAIAEKVLKKSRESQEKEGKMVCHGYEKKGNRLLMVHVNKKNLRLFFKDGDGELSNLKNYKSGSFPCGWGTKTPLTHFKYIKNENDFKEALDLLRIYLSYINKN